MSSSRPLRRISVAMLAAVAGAGCLAAPAQAVAPPSPTGRYIVALRPTLGLGADAVGTAADRLAAGRVDRTFPDLDGFAATLTAADAARIAADPAVAAVQPAQRVHIDATQRNARWNLDRIDQRGRKLTRTYTPLSAGGGVSAYIIDTGIRTTHREFGGRAFSGYDFVDGDAGANDCNGHGTHVAGTIGGANVGVAKRVRLVGVKVLDCDGGGWIEDVIDGVNWVTRNARKPAVANMSLGGDANILLERAVRRSIASGVTYVVAAGNESTNACASSPGNIVPAITVGATNASDTRASFSNYGRCLDLFAPGVSIYSAARNGGYATMSGTSMASPHVAGAVAMMLASAPSLTPAKVSERLLASSTRSLVRNAGSKSPNRLLFTPAPPKAATITTASLPAATVGVAYSQQLRRSVALTGTWTVAAGVLPAGLKLSRAGLLSGTPTTAGARKVTFRFTDFVPRVANRTITVTVN